MKSFKQTLTFCTFLYAVNQLEGSPIVPGDEVSSIEDDYYIQPQDGLQNNHNILNTICPLPKDLDFTGEYSIQNLKFVELSVMSEPIKVTIFRRFFNLNLYIALQKFQALR